MPKPTFKGPRAKLARAKKHIEELNALSDKFLKSLEADHYKEPFEGFYIAHKMRIISTVPDEISTVASDAIGNLRSVLDLSVCECGHLAGAKDLKDTYFHFAPHAAKWDETVKGRTKAAPPHIVQLMRSMKPWEEDGGNKLLYALSRLCAKDKHQLLVPLCGGSNATKWPSMQFQKPKHLRIPLPNWDRKTQSTLVMVTDPETVVDLSGVAFQVFIAFDEVDSIPGAPAIGVLDKLAGTIEQIVGQFEDAMTTS